MLVTSSTCAWVCCILFWPLTTESADQASLIKIISENQFETSNSFEKKKLPDGAGKSGVGSVVSALSVLPFSTSLLASFFDLRGKQWTV